METRRNESFQSSGNIGNSLPSGWSLVSMGRPADPGVRQSTVTYNYALSSSVPGQTTYRASVVLPLEILVVPA
jgi:hypothetical protein